jgi:hypothetical protein
VANLQVGTAAPPAGTVKVLTINFTDEQRALRGVSDKKNNTCKTFVATYINAPSGLFNPATAAGQANLANGLCETGAHEAGHLLCATHDQNAPVTRTITQANGLVITGNGLARSTMTTGALVTDAEKAADGTGFTQLGLATIQSAVNKLRNQEPGWDLLGAFEGKEQLQIVSGRFCDTVEIDGQIVADPIREDDSVEVTASLTGNRGEFEFGWINAKGEFFAALKADAPQGTFDFNGGDLIDFAVAGAPGGAWEGMVFPFHEFGEITRQDGQIPASFSEVPSVATDYFQMLDITFDLSSIDQPSLTAELSTVFSSGTDGMRIVGP